MSTPTTLSTYVMLAALQLYRYGHRHNRNFISEHHAAFAGHARFLFVSKSNRYGTHIHCVTMQPCEGNALCTAQLASHYSRQRSENRTNTPRYATPNGTQREDSTNVDRFLTLSFTGAYRSLSCRGQLRTFTAAISPLGSIRHR